MTDTDTTTIIVRSGRAFRGSSQWGYEATVDENGHVSVWDDVAEAWTQWHSLSPAQIRYVRRTFRAEVSR